MLSDEEVQAIVEYGHETPSIEFKQDGSPTDKAFAALIARAAMALANRRDGGHIIIGLADGDPGGSSSGMIDVNVEAWVTHDDTMARLNTYADPPMSLEIAERALADGRRIVLIQVAEFDTVPILCNRDYPGKLVKGELYTRSLAKPESSRFVTQNELRVVLELATQKQLRRFVETSRHAGVDIGLPYVTTDDDLFAEQSSAASRQLGAEDLGARFEIKIRPQYFDQRRIAYEDLDAVVSRCKVEANGWQFPTEPQVINRGDDWVEGKNSWRARPDHWRLTQSGFLYVVQPLPVQYGVDNDYFGADTEPAGHIPVWWIIAIITLILELAARFQQLMFPNEPLRVQISLLGAKDWQLVVADASRAPFRGAYLLGTDAWQREEIITPEGALTGTRIAAASLATDLLLRFGWTGVTSDLVASIQEETIGSTPP